MKNPYDVLDYQVIKETVSHYCSFSGGKQRIMNLEPVFSKLSVMRELKRSKEALTCTIAYGAMPFVGIHDITPLVYLAQKGGVLSPQELLTVAMHNTCVHSCIQYCKKVEAPIEALNELTSSLVTFDSMQQEIERCISQGYEVNDSASSALRSIRNTIRQVSSQMDQVLQQYIRSHSSQLMDHISATRNDRRVVLVKNSYKNQMDGIQYGDSASGQAVYVEPGCLIPYNNQLQSLRQKEQTEIERILRMLSGIIQEKADALLANMETLAILDSLFAKARYGKEMDGCIASINEDEILCIKGARHPLIAKDQVVKNTYRMMPPHKMLLITGPNTGGKTVSLKTIGLFVIMTMSGIPVPCDEATIPLYDQLFVDIGDQQSIEQSLSTFSGHISSLAKIFQKATTKSLVILDELCSGTDPKEGENLAIAILEFFRSHSIYVIASTHYSKLKTYGKQHDDVLLASVAFDMEKLQPTYQYKEGFTGQSNAFDIALRYGFDPAIIQRARELKKEDVSDQELLVEKLDQQLAKNEQLQQQLAEELQKAKDEKERWIAKQEEFMRKEDAMLEAARMKANQIVEQTQIEAEEIIEELKQKDSYKMHETIALTTQLQNLIEEEPMEEYVDPTIEVGDTVRVIQTDYLAEVLAIDKKQVLISCNGIRMKVSKEGLRKETKKKVKKEKSSVYVNKHKSFSTECNLIGMRVEEAMIELNKYLDDALLMNVAFVRIIHGHGTGALRKAVWQTLKQNKHVKSYRLGGASEGGSGATIVVFREV
ncbi:MAG: endonuclease MutS2 [Erysipelotrichaceae bacterium]|nr:endonuclease MutS2 [Erysipelotrichaceae bacterium]